MTFIDLFRRAQTFNSPQELLAELFELLVTERRKAFMKTCDNNKSMIYDNFRKWVHSVPVTPDGEPECEVDKLESYFYGILQIAEYFYSTGDTGLIEYLKQESPIDELEQRLLKIDGFIADAEFIRAINELEEYQKWLTNQKELPDQVMNRFSGYVCGRIGVVYYQLKKFDLARKEISKAIKFSTLADDVDGLLANTENMTEIALRSEDDVELEKWLKKYLALLEQYGMKNKIKSAIARYKTK